MRRLRLLLLSLMLLSTMALARQSAQGDCVLGGKVVVTNGLNSTTKVMASYPSCTVTVSVHGGGLATIYSDNAGTVLANPFTATTAGHWSWYADNGHYDVLISGGTPQAMPSTFTYSDIILEDPAQLVTGVCGLTFSSTVTFTAASCSDFTLTLTGNVTTSTVSGALTGQQLSVSLCQDAAGGRTFSWPPAFTRPPTIDSRPNTCTNAAFFFDGVNWRQMGASGDSLIAAAGGSLSGTFAGSPTWSGNHTFNGSVALNASGSLSGIFTGSPTWPGTHTFTGQLITNTLNGVRIVTANTAGTDCGQKINSMDTLLGAVAGEIWVDETCGLTMSTAVYVGGNPPTNNYHVLRFVQGGTWINSAPIHISTIGSAVICPDQSVGGAPQTGFKLGPVMIQQANSVNMPAIVSMDAGETVFRNCIVDGNKANNTTSIGVLVNAANRVQIHGITAQNAATHGIKFLSTVADESCCAHIQQLMSIYNGLDGIYSVDTADVFLIDSEIENNGANGIELVDSPTWRITHTDIGGNGSNGTGNCSTAGLAGLCIYGTAAGIKSYGPMLSNIQFGNQYQEDFKMVCYDTVGGAATCGNAILNGVFFLGSGFRTPNNTWNAMTFVDGGANMLNGIYIAPGPASHLAKYGISVSETGASRYVPSTIGAITWNASAFGTARFNDATSNGLGGLQVVVNGGASSGSTLDIYDISSGAATPHKFIRVSGGNLQMLSSGFGAVIMTVSDTGVLFPGVALQTPNAGSAFTGLIRHANNDKDCWRNNAAGADDCHGEIQTQSTGGCATAAAAGAVCTVTVTWPSAFADTSYRAACNGRVITSGVPMSGGLTALVAASVTFQTVAATAAAAQYTNVDCVAVHN
jgi:hypothetical protein